MFIIVDCIKKIWNMLTNSYRRQRKKEKDNAKLPSGSGHNDDTSDPISFEYYSEMSFLDDSVIPRKTISNITTPDILSREYHIV